MQSLTFIIFIVSEPHTDTRRSALFQTLFSLFFQCRLSKTLPSSCQYVTCQTCNNHAIDRCYCNIPRAYKSSSLPGLGRPLHNTVHLLPAYRQRPKTSKPLSRQAKRWIMEAIDAFNTCFDDSDWDVFFDAESSLHEVVDRVTS